MFKRIMLAISVAIVAFAIGLHTAELVLARQQEPPQETLLRQQSFGTWQYRAMQVQDPHGLFGTNTKVVLSIESSLRGRANLERVLATQRSAGEQLLRSQPQIPAVVIPRQPLALERLPAFVKQHGLTVRSYTIVARASNGELITLFGAPEGDQLVPTHNLDLLTQSIETNQATKLQLQGIVALETQIDRASFTSLTQDRAVLGLDLTTALATEDLLRAQPVDRSAIEVVPAPLYWANVEDQ